MRYGQIAEHRERNSMKRLIISSMVVSTIFLTSSLFAQENDHGEIGVYADYFRLSEAGNTNFAGVGARIGFNVAPRVQVEGQLTYDFAQNLKLTNTSSTAAITINRSSATLLHGFVGPKVVGGTEHARIFGTLQGGFIRFGVSNGTVVNGLTTSLSNFGDSSTHVALYPAVGTELYVGAVGLRLEVGDVMYWTGKPHHNLSVRFGPQIKF
jgi:hypothetical protein